MVSFKKSVVTRLFCLFFILFNVWLNVIKDASFLIFNDERYKIIKPLKYMLKIKYVNKTLLFKFLFTTPNKKPIEGKKMAFIILWASSLSICFSFIIKLAKITLLGKPFNNPIIIRDAPFPLILNNG